MVFRPSPSGPEVLYLQRSPELAFHAGYWVFPGGRIDPPDYAVGGPGDEATAARCAAVREAREEAGIDIPIEGVEFAIHWTTPEESPIRFSTWFFVGEMTTGIVEIDGGEIHDHQWMRPADALGQHARGGMKLAAPTFALTTRLGGCPDIAAVFAAVEAWPHERLLGRLHDVPGGQLAVYEQDAAYDCHGDALEQPGPRHRLWMVDGGWRYQREL